MPGKNGTTDSDGMPPVWRHELQAQLASGESLVGWFQPDLNSQLDFAEGMVVLTDRRLLAAEGGGLKSWRSWPLKDIAKLRARESAGLGALELLSRTALEATWHYTAARSAAATQFVGAYQREVNSASNKKLSKHGAAVAAFVCPSCGATIEPPQIVCDVCTPTAAPPPVRSLWRLGRFAKPRANMILLGLVLALASTAAGLVPPYLTIPLLRNVLIPHKTDCRSISLLCRGISPAYLAPRFSPGF